jgi:hypothetical protein
MEIEFIDEIKEPKFKWKWIQTKLEKLFQENIIDTLDNNCLTFIINLKELYTGNTILKSHIRVLYIIDTNILTLYCKNFTDVENYGIISNESVYDQITLLKYDETVEFTKTHDKMISELFNKLFKKLRDNPRCLNCFAEKNKNEKECINCLAKKSLKMFFKESVGRYNQTKCNICLSKFRYNSNIACIKCGHYFHLKCIAQLERKQKFESAPCPICKIPFKNIVAGSDCLYYKLDFNSYDDNEYENIQPYSSFEIIGTSLSRYN